jgi:N-terminal acetyltransferase B complex catalytic subunit
MSTTRRFRPSDLFRFNQVNLDKLTETYNMHFYFSYMGQWPEFQHCVTTPSGAVSAYLIGKAEGDGRNWHGHVSAVTVGPAFRRLGLARNLMRVCEALSEATYDCFFVDLFVRRSNTVAIDMYKGFGYVVYRTIRGYYSDGEDAYDMRRALRRDVRKESVVPIGVVGAEDVELTL